MYDSSFPPLTFGFRPLPWIPPTACCLEPYPLRGNAAKGERPATEAEAEVEERRRANLRCRLYTAPHTSWYTRFNIFAAVPILRVPNVSRTLVSSSLLARLSFTHFLRLSPRSKQIATEGGLRHRCPHGHREQQQL